VEHSLRKGRGLYIYVLEGDPVEANGNRIPVLGAAQIDSGMDVRISTGWQCRIATCGCFALSRHNDRIKNELVLAPASASEMERSHLFPVIQDIEYADRF